MVFFGTPGFAVASLEALTEFTDVVAVVCQPDKPAGRGNTVTAPATKTFALSHGITVVQPAKLRDGSFAEWMKSQSVDVSVVVAYGRILPEEVLAIPRYGCVNVHGSVLPRHRGAAPINWAILSGDTETGVTLMLMDPGLDTGPMLSIKRTPIGENDTAEELFERLSKMGAEMVRDDLGHHLAGMLPPVAQDSSRATLAPPLTREQARIDWSRPARTIHNQVRGLRPWPGTWTTLSTRRLIVTRTRLDGPPAVMGGAPGEVVSVTPDSVWVATSDGLIALTELQLEGKKRMAVREFTAGHPMRVGALLGDHS